MDKIIALSREFGQKFEKFQGAGPERITIWEHTQPFSPLRRFIFDHIIEEVDPTPWLDCVCIDNVGSGAFDFMKDLARAAILASRNLDHGKTSDPFKRDRCMYHQHPGKPVGYLCTKKSSKS